jgi:mono/diheme cytochrome c family protein
VKRNTTMFLLLTLALAAVMFAQGTAGQEPAQGQGRGGGRSAAPTGNATPPTSPVTGNAANGKALYFNYSCYACHGYNGETGRAFVGNWSANLANETNFIRFLRARANVAPVAPSTSMPNYPENTLNDRQSKDIYAYIRTFKSNAPDVKDAPALNAILKSASRPYKP